MLEASARGSASTPPEGSAVGPENIVDCLEDAELLVGYAAEAGIAVDDDVRRSVLHARRVGAGALDEEQEGKLWEALTRLSVSVRPASAESLRKCGKDSEASRTIGLYRTVAMVLGIVILPYSCAAFVATSTCDAIGKDIETANALAVTLYVPLTARPPGGNAEPAKAESEAQVRLLQQLAATLRDIYTRAAQLNIFIARGVADPYRAPPDRALEIHPSPPAIASETLRLIEEYQTVRHFAQTVREWVSITFGAATSCILPTLYALLGACAFLIRTFERQVRTRSFTGHDRPTARFVVAAIGGFVVGLFGDFGGGHATFSPLAIAFLVGYAADVFFYFLESLVDSFGRQRTEAKEGSQPQSPSVPAKPAQS